MRRPKGGSGGTMYQFPTTTNLRTNKHNNNNKPPIIDDADIAAGEAAAAAALLKSSASLASSAAASPNPSRAATPHTTPSRPALHKHHSHASDRSNTGSTVQFSAPNSSDFASSVNGTGNHPSLYLSSAPTSMNSLAKATSDLEFFEDSVSEPVLVLGMDISHLSPQWQFVVCATGVFWFSLLYGYLQELISVQLCSRKLGLFLAAAQFSGYTVLAYFLRQFVYAKEQQISRTHHPSGKGSSMSSMNGTSNGGGSGKPGLWSLLSGNAASSSSTVHVPFLLYLGLSLLRAVDLGMTNLAMQYINYPAKTLMKSSRVVFTMLFGVIISRKRYGWKDYAIVLAMCVGLALFMHADATSSAIFHHMGVVMLVISLVCDGAITNMSETIMKQFGVGQDEFIFRMYSIALVAITGAAAWNGDLRQGLNWMTQPGTYDELSLPLDQRTWSVGGKLFCLTIFSSMGFFGSSCSAAITKNFGALTMSITSTARKAVTLFLSFFLFGNVCTSEHVTGIAIFIAALTAKSLRRRGDHKKKKRKRAPLHARKQLELQMGNATATSHVHPGNGGMGGRDEMMPSKLNDEYENLIRRTASHESGVSGAEPRDVHIV